jgi:hypothetical protein
VGYVAVLLLTVVANTVAGLELWMPGREFVYWYETSLEAGAMFPLMTVPQWTMSAELLCKVLSIWQWCRLVLSGEYYH